MLHRTDQYNGHWVKVGAGGGAAASRREPPLPPHAVAVRKVALPGLGAAGEAGGEVHDAVAAAHGVEAGDGAVAVRVAGT